MGSVTKLTETDTELAAIASEYCRLKEAVKHMNETLETFREILLSAADHEPLKELRVGGYEIKMTSKSKKSFDLKTAEKVIDQKILEPFYRVTKFDDLRVRPLPDQK